MEEKSLEFQFAHQGIAVENMEESIEWYGKVFGVHVISDELSSEIGATPLKSRIVHMVGSGNHFEIFKYIEDNMVIVNDENRDSATTLRYCGNKHVCYEVDIPRFVRERVVPNNVKIDHGPEKQGDNWQLFIMDPNGILYEFHDIGGAAREPHAFDDFECILFDC